MQERSRELEAFYYNVFSAQNVIDCEHCHRLMWPDQKEKRVVYVCSECGAKVAKNKLSFWRRLFGPSKWSIRKQARLSAGVK
jgi:ribosomal protein L37AE/L43A